MKIKKTILTILFILPALTFAQDNKVVVTIQPDARQQTISRHIYGHFAEHLGRCIYDGFWVDPNLDVAKEGRIRMDIVKALRDIDIPNLRWPGGCFADEYQWKDGIGEPDKRPRIVNSKWGEVVEDNSFGTDEFMKLCDLLGCEPYLSANVATSTPKDFREWVEYLNYSGDSYWAEQRKKNGHEKPYGVSFFGIGNESWGCGGNMTPEFYSDEYKRFQGFAYDYSGNKIKRIACGPNGDDYNWMETCMKKIPFKMLWGISLHYYTIATDNWSKKGPSTQFDEKEYFRSIKNALFMDELLGKHSAIMDIYDPKKKVALVVDEWGIWTDPEPGTNPRFLYQQNSMRDALIAASTLNIFNKHSDRVRMANLAQSVNVLQSLVLTDNEKMLLTPTYYVFKMYKNHQDAELLQTNVASDIYEYGMESVPEMNVSASRSKNGKIHVTMVNLNPKKEISTDLIMLGIGFKQIKGEVLTSDSYSDYNSFDNADKVVAKQFNSIKKSDDNIAVVKMPPLSVVALEIF